MGLTEEYSTLRDELLQLFKEQSQLAFVTALTSAAIVYAVVDSPVPAGAGVAVWEVVLAGIAWKLTANYHRLYRVGTYVKVVHEMKGNPDHTPGINEPAWHTRIRIIGIPGTRLWRWGSGARANGWFLRLLGVCGLMLVVASWHKVWPPSIPEAVGTFLSAVAFVFLWLRTRALFRVHEMREDFEKALWKVIRNSDKTKPGA
jgi:hypothetical protein